MSNFVAIKIGGWALEDPLLSDEIDLFQEDLLKCANFTDGSTHAPTAPIVLGGYGIQLTGTGRIQWRRAALDYATFGGTAGIEDGDLLDVTSMASAVHNLRLESDSAGAGTVIEVAHHGGGYNLTVIDDDSSATLVVMMQGDFCRFSFNGTAWVLCGGTAKGVRVVVGTFESPPYELFTSGAHNFATDDGGDWYANTTTGADLYWRTCPAVSGELVVVTSVSVDIDGEAHSASWPPDNLPIIKAYRYTVSTGVVTEIGTLTDTSDQSAYEARHTLTISGLTTSFTAGQLLIVRVRNENGTNAVDGLRISAPTYQANVGGIA